MGGTLADMITKGELATEAPPEAKVRKRPYRKTTPAPRQPFEQGEADEAYTATKAEVEEMEDARDALDEQQSNKATRTLDALGLLDDIQKQLEIIRTSDFPKVINAAKSRLDGFKKVIELYKLAAEVNTKSADNRADDTAPTSIKVNLFVPEENEP